MADSIRLTGDGATLTDAAKRHATLTVAEHATDAAELATLLDMLGLPPVRAADEDGDEVEEAMRGLLVVLILTAFWSAYWIFQAKFINDIWPHKGRVEWLTFAVWLVVAVAVSTGVVYAVEAWT